MATEQAAGGDNNKMLAEKILKQIEFYFGDINLRRDKFLQEQMKLDDGWVPLTTMVKFNRLRQLSEDTGVIANAIAQSELVEVDEEKTKIRRKSQLPEPADDPQFANRVIYVKGFPKEATLDELMEYFANHGKTEYIMMRRYNKTVFKGSCFVTFANEEDAKKYIEAKDLTYKDTPLLRMLRSSYFEMKKNEREERKGKKSDGKSEEPVEVKEDVSVKGALLNVENIPEKTTDRDLKPFFAEFCKVAWVDIFPTEHKARVRFTEENGAYKALEKAQSAQSNGVKSTDTTSDSKVTSEEKTSEVSNKKDEDVEDASNKDGESVKEVKCDEKAGGDSTAQDKCEEVDKKTDSKMETSDDKKDMGDKEKETNGSTHLNTLTITYKDVKLTCTVVTGDEEKEHWINVHKMKLKSGDAKKRPFRNNHRHQHQRGNKRRRVNDRN